MSSTGGGPEILGLAARRVALPGGHVGPATVWLDRGSGRIAAVDPMPAGETGAGRTRAGASAGARGPVVDLGPRLLAPGYVDVHVHGAAGVQVNGDSADQVFDAVAALAAFHATHGTTTLVPTAVTDSPKRLAATVTGIARAARTAPAPSPGGARVAGSHLEGPFIAVGRAGAQDPAHIRLPDRAELNRLLELGEGTVRLVTLAPELPGADDLIADCLAAGAAVALGHTDADYDTANRAFGAGASHVTHLWNAMAGLHHRRPGLVGAALANHGVTVEIVCDLHHVHPSVVALTARCAPGRSVLVTDAVAATGAAPGRYTLGNVSVDVDGTRATLTGDPATLAGSVLTMDVAVRNAAGPGGLGTHAALAAASATPASVLASGNGLGTLAPGAPADLVVLEAEPELDVTATLVGGVPVHDPQGLFS